MEASTASTELLRAVERGDVESVKLHLLDPDCDVNARMPPTDFGYTALMLAVKLFVCSAPGTATSRSCVAIVEELLKHRDIDVNIADTPWVGSALHIAFNAHLNIGAFYNPGGGDGHSYRNAMAAIKLLLAHQRCDVNVQDRPQRTTPLMSAVRNASDDAVDLLLSHPDIDTRLTDVHGDTAIDIMLDPGICNTQMFNTLKCTAILKRLAVVRPEHNVANDHAVAEAIAFSPLVASEVLLDSRCGFTANSFMRSKKSQERESALHAAVRLDSLAKVTLLLRNAADPTIA